MQDPEGDVRAGAAKNATGYYDLVGVEKFVGEVLPAVRELAADVCLPVRVAVATAVMDLAGKVPSSLSPTHIIPLSMQLLRDESSEVRALCVSARVWACMLAVMQR